MKYFSKAKLGKIESGTNFFVDMVTVDDCGSHIHSSCNASLSTSDKFESYPDEYEEFLCENTLGNIWRPFYLETEFKIGDGLVDMSTGVFYEVISINACVQNGSDEKITYTIKNIFNQCLSFEEEALSDYVYDGMYKHIQINNENDFFEDEEDLYVAQRIFNPFID